MKKNFSYLQGITLLLLLSYFQPVFSIPDETQETDIQSIALGNVRSLSPELLNPAGIAFRDKGEIGISVLDRFGMKELNTYGIYAIFPDKRIDVGLKFATYGYEEYRLIRGEVNLAKKITPQIAIGVQLGCLYENSFLRERNRMYLIADPGIYWKIHPKLELAFVSENLINTSDFLKPVFYIGLVYKTTNDLYMFAEGGLGIQQKSHLSLGIQYEILSQLSVRCGFRSDSLNPALGASWDFGRWKISAAFLMHDKLELSSGIGIHYSL